MKRRRQGRHNTFWMFVITALLISAFVGGANPPKKKTSTTAKKTSANSIEMAVKLVGLSKRRLAHVKDYTASLVKQERVQGKLLPQQIIELKVAHQPFSVYMHWKAPADLMDQEVCYVDGKYDGNMRVRPTGLLRALGWVTLHPRDPRARQTSNHSVTEAGLANLIDQFEKSYKLQANHKQLTVKISDYMFNKRKSVRIETTHLKKIPGVQDNYRNVLYLDRETWLPTRVERYDWPVQGGDPKGALLEVYSYLNIKKNVNLPAATFNK